MNFLLSPLTFFWVLLLCSLCLFKFKQNLKAIVFFSVATVQLFLFSSTPIPALMISSLEKKYPTQPNFAVFENKEIPIVVLGGGYVNDSKLSPLNQLSDAALARLVQGIYLYKKCPNRELVFSGYSKSNNKSIAQVMAESAVLMGVQPRDTIMLNKSASTWNEALDFKNRFGSTKQFFLVTSAAHMPRAIESFRSLGLNPIAAPTNFLVKEDDDRNVYSWKPSSTKITMVEKAMHEYLGMWYYRIVKKV